MMSLLKSPINNTNKNSYFYDIFDVLDEINGCYNTNNKIDIYKKDNEYHVIAELPGYNKNDIDISTEKNILTISADVSKEAEDNERKYIKKEIYKNKFSRSITFHGNIDAENIKATYKEGILDVKIPIMLEKQNNKKITIN